MCQCNPNGGGGGSHQCFQPITASLSQVRSSNDLGTVHEAYLALVITKEEYRQVIQSAFQVHFLTDAVK